MTKTFDNLKCIKIFNTTIQQVDNFEYIQNSRLDDYPIYKFQIKTFNDDIIDDFFTDYDKLIQYLRIFKIKQIRKYITSDELIDLKIIQFLKDNYGIITLINII